MNTLQKVLLSLFVLPVAFAQHYNLDRTLFSVLTALVSVSLLVLASTVLLGRMREGVKRTSLSLVLIYLLSFYYAAMFVSYYLQGSYFNQQYYFHFNLTTLFETRAAYYPLLFITLFWTASVLGSLYYFRHRMPVSSYPTSAMVLAVLLAIGLDPGLRPATISAIETALSPSYDSLETIPWEELGLNPEALEVSIPKARAGKNLVLIFLEGLEAIYTDERLFPGLTPNLNALSEEGLHLENMHQVEGSGWTMAGLVSSLCATPLLYESSLGGNEVLFSSLLDRAICLPDTLAAAGYEQVFMGGASLEFAGKGGFLREHNYDRTLGREQLVRELAQPDYINGWGLYDDSLFPLAFEQFNTLAESGEPFNLTFLTVDTHHPSGEPSASCNEYGAIDNSILHSVHCTDFLVGEFIEQLRAHPAYEDTLVVLVSDHLGMRNNAFPLFPMDYPRRLYFTALNAGNQSQLETFATPLDISPTLLSLLGVEHNTEFLAGSSVLQNTGLDNIQQANSADRLNALRYINSNHLSTVDSEVLYSLTRVAVNEIDYSDGIENIEYSLEGLEFDATNGDPHFLLPPLSGTSFDDAMLYVTIEADEALAVAIYYEEVLNSGYSESNTLRREIGVGLNQLVFDLEGVADESRIRIDPGHVPGHYTIRSIEIRSS